MDIKAELKANRKKLQDIAREINQLNRQRQALLQEALRLEGEQRVLSRLDGGKSKENVPVAEKTT